MNISYRNHNSIKRWSFAPELKGAIPFVKFLKAKNILPSIAHTDAIYEEVIEAFENGSHACYAFVFCHVGRNKKKCISLCRRN